MLIILFPDEYNSILIRTEIENKNVRLKGAQGLIVGPLASS